MGMNALITAGFICEALGRVAGLGVRWGSRETRDGD